MNDRHYIGFVQVAAAVVSIGAGIAQTIAGVKDAKKRREFEQSIAMLTLQQQEQLNAKILNAKTQNERLSILTNAVVQLRIGKEEQANKKELTTALVIIGGGIVLIGILFAVKKIIR